MAVCCRCGKKLSLFEVPVNGICPACIKAETDAKYGQETEEERLLRKQMEKAAHEAEQHRMLESGNLPDLPCLTPKALAVSGENLVFIGKKKTVSVPIRNIASFTLKKPSLGSNGSIIVQLQKGNDSFIGLGGLVVGFGNEMTAVFKPSYLETAELYEKYVLQKTYSAQDAKPAEQNKRSAPMVDDLRALKQLVDEGILTEEEFAAKKKQLLGI